MVRNTLKLTKFGGFAVAALTLLTPAVIINDTNAACITDISTGIKACDDGTFKVAVQEILNVTVSPDGAAASGSELFLESKVNLAVSSNNVAGFLATMTSKDEATSLVNSAAQNSSIPTLSSSKSRSNLKTQADAAWGFGLATTSDNITGSDGMMYNPIAANAEGVSPYKILENNKAGSASKDIFFGAKASSSTVSGTYERAVLISVVSGVHDEPEVQEPDLTDGTIAGTQGGTQGGTTGGNSTSGNRYVASTSSTETEETTTNRGSGNSSSYNGYAYPQGETNTVATINEGTPLATGLAITACIAAVFGIFFFILLFKRRKDEDEEEQY